MGEHREILYRVESNGTRGGKAHRDEIKPDLSGRRLSRFADALSSIVMILSDVRLQARRSRRLTQPHVYFRRSARPRPKLNWQYTGHFARAKNFILRGSQYSPSVHCVSPQLT